MSILVAFPLHFTDPTIDEDGTGKGKGRAIEPQSTPPRPESSILRSKTPARISHKKVRKAASTMLGACGTGPSAVIRGVQSMGTIRHRTSLERVSDVGVQTVRKRRSMVCFGASRGEETGNPREETLRAEAEIRRRDEAVRQADAARVVRENIAILLRRHAELDAAEGLTSHAVPERGPRNVRSFSGLSARSGNSVDVSLVEEVGQVDGVGILVFLLALRSRFLTTCLGCGGIYRPAFYLRAGVGRCQGCCSFKPSPC